MSVLKPEIVAARLDRARQGVGQGIVYHMGRGGYNPDFPNPVEAYNWDHNLSDCSGFLSGVMETRRRPKPGVRDFWIETTEMVHDVLHAQQCFVQVEGEPGCFVAYGDSNGESGHCALVVSVEWNPDGSLKKLIGIDCSHGSYRSTGDAIHEHDITAIFDRDDAVLFAFRQDLAP